MSLPRRWAITDTPRVPVWSLNARLEAAAALPPSVRGEAAVMLRDPELDGRALTERAKLLRERTRALGMSLVINDRLDLALAVGADGVHLGRRSVSVSDARALIGSRAWISVACHGVSEVVGAARAGADAALLSPIFASPGKSAPLGVEALTAARRLLEGAGLSLHLVALGGVDRDNGPGCLAAGADGVAAIRADLWAAPLAPRG